MNPPSSSLSVSVVVPSLNQGHFIRETIDSILNQPLERIEVIVVDGGSTDGTVDILRSYGDRVSWTSEPDRGQGDALTKGFGRAKGDIVCYLNSDDVFEPGALAIVEAHFRENPAVDWLFGRCRIIDASGRPIRSFVELYKRSWARHARSRFSLLVLNYIPQPATFWRTSAMERVGSVDRSLYYAMDYDLWLRLSTVGDPAFVDRYLARFRIHDSSKSLNGARKQMDEARRVAQRRGAGALLPAHRLHDWLTLITYGSLYGQQLTVPSSRG